MTIRKRMLSILLVLVMILGIVPGGVFAAETEDAQAQTIAIDFAAFAKNAAEQPWWDNLKETDNTGIRMVGSRTKTDTMTAAQKTAYEQMQAYLKEEGIWWIDEEQAQFGYDYYAKRMYIDASGSDATGLRFYVDRFASQTNDNAAKIMLTVVAEADGLYNMEFDILKEAGPYSTIPKVDNIGKGCGYGNIYVNDALIYADYWFSDDSTKNVRAQESLGAVRLSEGENSIVIEMTNSYTGALNNGRRLINLCGLTFTPVEECVISVGGGMQMNLHDYVPFDAKITDAQMQDEDVAKITLGNSGSLLVEGLREGETAIEIYNGSKLLYTLGVTVLAPSAASVPQPIRVDLKNFVRRASTQSWWNDLTDVTTAGKTELKKVGSDQNVKMTAKERSAYEAMMAWMEENLDWTFSRQMKLDSAAGNRLYLAASDNIPWAVCHNGRTGTTDGASDITVEVNAETAGWYALNVDMITQDPSSKDYPLDTSTNSGGSYADILVNGEVIAMGYKLRGEYTSDMVHANFGKVFLNEGANTVTVRCAGEYNNPVRVGYGGRVNIYVIGMMLQPLSVLSVEVGEVKTLSLATSFLTYGKTYGKITAQAEGCVGAEINAYNELVMTGTEEGSGTVILYDGDEVLAVLPVAVTQEETAIYYFAKASQKTVNGFDSIEHYSDLEEDDLRSEPWKFEDASGRAYYDTDAEAATLLGGIGSYASFGLQVPEGEFLPELSYTASPSGGKTAVYLDDAYLGTVDTYAPVRRAETAVLRPVQLEEGEHILRMEVVGKHKAAAATPLLYWQALMLCEGTSQLTLDAGALSAKVGRLMQTTLSGGWDTGIYDDLAGAKLTAEVSDADVLQAAITPATLTEPAVLQVQASRPVDDAYITVKAEVSGVTATCVVPVQVLQASPVVSADIRLEGADGGQIPRHSARNFCFDMTCEDGDKALTSEVDISYEVSDSAILAVDEQTHALHALADGEADVTVTVSQENFTYAETFHLTVATTGENRIAAAASSFDDTSYWSGLAAPSANRWVAMEVANDGTGNKALKITVEPGVSYNTGSTTGLMSMDGKLAELTGGQLYELRFRYKVDDYTRAPGATYDPRLIMQLYDFTNNAYSAATVDEYYSSYVLDYANAEKGVWYEVALPVRAPIETEGLIYGLVRLTYSPHYAVPGERGLEGFDGTFWFDDVELREVGFEAVEVEAAEDLNASVIPVAVYARPVATTGNSIFMDAGSVVKSASYRSSNEDVLTVTSAVGAITEKFEHTNNNEYASANVKLVGKNDTAQVLASYTIGGVTREGALDVTVSGKSNILRDVNFLLNDSKSLVLPRGEKAVSTVTGLTTQLTKVEQEEFDSLYFATSDRSVATVDPVTGEVTCVGEGTATITAYGLLDSKAASDTVLITVHDETDLASIKIMSEVNYIGVGGTLKLWTEGMKKSGGKADMAKYPVAWSLNEEAQQIASISDDGRLTAQAVGTVTVTASVTVGDTPVSYSVQITLTDNSEHRDGILNFDFTDSGSYYILHSTLEENGIEINRKRTYGGAETIEMNQSGMILNVPVGEELVLDFMVKKPGWYRVEIRGRSLYYWGCLSGFYVDDTYVGNIDFGSDQTTTDKEGGFYNTIWLDAGVHTMIFHAEEASRIMPGRVTFFPMEDPGEVDIKPVVGKQELVPGETTQLTLDMRDEALNAYFLHYETSKPSYTNYYMLESSDPSVVKITRDLFTTTLTAGNPGTATITIKGEVLGKSVTRKIELMVKAGSISSADLTAERTTVEPGYGSFPLTLTARSLAGALQELPEGVTVTYESSDPSVAEVSAEGIVTTFDKLGSALITATLLEGEHVVQAKCWITVTNSKTEPSLYTNEERAIARENVLKYDWAWQQKEAAVSKADYYVENLEHIYNIWPHEGLPRNVRITLWSDEAFAICPACGTDLVAAGYGSAYQYLVDPIEDPWKVSCPHCKARFPSNDFASFYECGLDERGKFTVERAMANGGEKYLVNELYPERGEGWGVDDGYGWHTGELCAKGYERVYTFIAYANDFTMVTVSSKNGKHSMQVIMDALREAYIYTGDEKYGTAGAILVDRLADIYPDYDLTLYRANDYGNGDGMSKRGKIAGSIWECLVIQTLCKAVDAFWPCAENPEVIEFLQKYADRKGVAPEDITPEYLRRQAEENILLEARSAIERNYANGNFGFEQAAMAMAAVALDRMPETGDMLDWIYAASKIGGQYTDSYNTGGDLYNVFMSDIDRDGFGYEGSISYNGLWLSNLMDLADTLNGYDKIESADLWKHPKFFNLYTSYIDLTVCGRLSPGIHETSAPFQMVPTYVNVNDIMPAFLATENVKIAKTIYAANGNTVDGLHGDIFTKDPEYGVRNRIQQIINEHGEWDMSESGMLSGFGMAILREGPQRYIKGVNEKEFSSYWINFSVTATHTHHEALNLDFEAFGLPMCGNMGYPVMMDGNNPNRLQWNGNTVSNNTVVVDDMCQNANYESGFPKHFADDGYAKVMDIDSPDSYTQTDIYRRTVVTVKAENGVDYAVDFFRILGGSEHVYSFHGATRIQPATEGLSLVQQPFGTYAGADIPFGDNDFTGTAHGAVNTGSGYSWLWDVYRDEEPAANFSVDWAIEDYQHQLPTSAGIHMRLTMLSDEPMTEVALANGEPAQDGRAPDHVEFMLVRNSGQPGLDTLFTAVIEPYQVEACVESAELVEAVLVDGTEGVTDRVQAVKTVQTGGRVDYIVYATNPDCTYEIDGKFRFRGFAGVCSYRDDVLVYAWGSEVSAVEDKVLGTVIEALPAVTGKVLNFTKDLSFENTMTVSMDIPVSADMLTGKYIYVNNDGAQNGVYRIHGATVSGNTAVLDLQLQDMIRGYIDPFNMELGFRYNIAEGQTYSIPMSAAFDAMAFFCYQKDTVAKAGSKLTLAMGVEDANVTYKADGLVSGMKFNSASGVLTWTPAKAQAGKYPITIYAVQDGKTVGETSFVIYAVSYSGSSYAVDVCTHAKAVTYEDTIVCPACGSITKKASDEVELFDIAGSNMTLGSDLKLNILVENEKLGDGDYTVKITHDGQTVEKALVPYNSSYAYAAYSVCAKQMSDVITAEVYKDGVAVSNVYETSVRNYAMNILNNGQLGKAVKRLVVDMLNYGSEAQKFFGYNAENLANARLNAAQKDLATKTVECKNVQEKGANFYGTNVSLEDRIILNLFFKNCEDGMTATISYTDYTGTAVSVDAQLVQYKNDIYKVAIDEIVLADAFSPVTVTVYKDGAEFGSATDSVESYVARTGDSAINEAIMKFAFSAKQYLS